MIDTLVDNLGQARQRKILKTLGLIERAFVYVTLHRPSNVDHKENLNEIMAELIRLSREMPVVFPMHPRTRKMLSEFKIEANGSAKLIILDPVGYHDSLCLTENARFVLTDSGGLQEETTFFRTPCLTLRPNTERPVTVSLGSNRLTSLQNLKNGYRASFAERRPGGKRAAIMGWSYSQADDGTDSSRFCKMSSLSSLVMEEADKGAVKPCGPDMAAARNAALKVLAYCHANGWAGHDPYDALNSRIFKALPFLNARLPRLTLTQVTKRSPFNLRALLLIPKTQNPKGLALFLTAFLKLSKLGLLDHKEEFIGIMIEQLNSLRSPKTSYWCWGYNFPWQTRTLLVPQWAPNLVCTSFVANAFLDLYEIHHEARYLNMAVSAAEYILNDLYWTEDNRIASFNYPTPSSRSQVHNANFLGAALLCRVYKYSGDQKFLDPALKVARYSADRQHIDGSWDYGESAQTTLD